MPCLPSQRRDRSRPGQASRAVQIQHHASFSQIVCPSTWLWGQWVNHLNRHHIMYKVSHQSIIMPPLSVTTGPAFAFAIRTWRRAIPILIRARWNNIIYLTTSTQLFFYSSHKRPIGQCKNLDGDIVPGLTKLARGFSVVRNHHKLVAVAGNHLKSCQW